MQCSHCGFKSNDIKDFWTRQYDNSNEIEEYVCKDKCADKYVFNMEICMTNEQFNKVLNKY
jgi:hypothetical protein